MTLLLVSLICLIHFPRVFLDDELQPTNDSDSRSQLLSLPRRVGGAAVEGLLGSEGPSTPGRCSVTWAEQYSKGQKGRSMFFKNSLAFWMFLVFFSNDR